MRRRPQRARLPTRFTHPFQAREVGTELLLFGVRPRLRSVTGRVLARGAGLVRLYPPLKQPLSQAPPQIRPFHQDDFLRSLDHAGPQLTCILKGDWLGLYRCVGGMQSPRLPLLVGAGCPYPPFGT